MYFLVTNGLYNGKYLADNIRYSFTISQDSCCGHKTKRLKERDTKEASCDLDHK